MPENKEVRIVKNIKRLMAPSNYIPYTEIATKLDISEGDVVLLTSDILKLAMKSRKMEGQFSAARFLESFMEALGNSGTLLIPAYNFDLESGDAYSIKKTIPMTGSLAIAAMKMEGYIRTAHPLHSFLVWGKDAGELSQMDNKSSFGQDSPFAYLHDKNALMVFAGTGIAEAMTFTHYVEACEKVKYRKHKNLSIKYTDIEGISNLREYNIFSKKPGWTMDMGTLEESLSQAAMQQIIINEVPFSMLRCKEAFEYIRNDIRENKAASIARFNMKLYFRDVIKQCFLRYNIFRTTYGKIRSAKRIR